MTRLAGVVLSTMGLIAFGVGAPATYDQRQDGDLNFSGKLENILIVIASPSSEPAKPSVDDSELAGYLSLLGGREPQTGTATQFYGSTEDEDSDAGSSKRESEDQEKEPGPKPVTSTDHEKVKAPKARSLWGQDQAQDEGGRSSDHNEVGLLHDSHLTLLGDGIEDCGPERRRNSYGICQPYSEE